MKSVKLMSGVAMALALALTLTLAGAQAARASDWGQGMETTVYRQTVVWYNPATGQTFKSEYTWAVVREGDQVRRPGRDAAQRHANQMRAQGWIVQSTSGPRVVNRIVST